MTLAVEGLVAGYGRVRVLDGLSVRVAAGECVGILGPNGMGKTTALKAIVGLLPAWAGTVTLNGTPLHALAAPARARAGIGYVPQGRQIFPALSARDNLHFAAAAKGMDRVRAEAEALAAFPELRRLLGRPGGTLSGGEQQMLALARALCGRPRVLLLDEPTEGVQPSLVQALAERLGAMRARLNLAVLLVEQNVDFVRALADRVAVIHRGRIVRHLPPGADLGAALEPGFGEAPQRANVPPATRGDAE